MNTCTSANACRDADDAVDARLPTRLFFHMERGVEDGVMLPVNRCKGGRNVTRLRGCRGLAAATCGVTP